MNEQQEQSSTIVSGTGSDLVSSPMYFPVSLLKLVVMSTCTMGIYELYWYYKNWCLIKEREKIDIMPSWRAFFAGLFCYSLFKRIQATAESQKLQKSIAPGLLATGWILCTILWKLPDPYWLVTYFAVFFLLPVQAVANDINMITNPRHESNSNFSGWNIAAIVVGGLIFGLGLMGTIFPSK